MPDHAPLTSLPASHDNALQTALQQQASAALVCADGHVLWGKGFGAVTRKIGELCFNTAMSGYQEIVSDLSYAGQIVCFTAVHIGNVGTNHEDNESHAPAAMGCVLRNPVTAPSNHRAEQNLDDWLKGHGIPGISGIDTRALTHRLRTEGAIHAMLIHDPDQNWNIEQALHEVRSWVGLEGRDLAAEVSTAKPYDWIQGIREPTIGDKTRQQHNRRITVIDYGVKHMILRLLVDRGCVVTVLPARVGFDDVIATQPDGVLLSNGPGDPAATGAYAVPVIRALLADKVPIFGICLGHQMLALALGANTAKMTVGHHGANHPVQNRSTNQAEITSQNHGFVVAADSLSDNLVTHRSLFDGTIAGLADPENRFFSVQYHPEASPGPTDSAYLFDQFMATL